MQRSKRLRESFYKREMAREIMSDAEAKILYKAKLWHYFPPCLRCTATTHTDEGYKNMEQVRKGRKK